MKPTFKPILTMLTLAVTLGLSSCSDKAKNDMGSKSELDSLRNEIMKLSAGNAMIAKNLVAFDTLDFTVFSKQEWARLHESHAKDIIVHWPDGHFTNGIERHIEDLQAMFVYAPNTQIKEHPIRIGLSNMTAVMGIMTGTFSKPMPIGEGKFIPPNGKSFKLPMCTIGIWKDGVMSEEYLFWDNQAYMNQIGLGK
jgi:hypothetical protein